MSTSTDSDETHRTRTDNSGLSPGVAEWLQCHYSECAGVLDLEEPFYLRDVEDAVKDTSTLRKMTNCSVIFTVDDELDDGYRQLWELDDRARDVLKDNAPTQTLPCGHRIAFEHVDAGYQCKVCGEIHSRVAVEACL